MTDTPEHQPPDAPGPAFTVTITNGTTKPYDPTLFNATIQSGAAEGDQVYDSANGYNGAPHTTLLAGRKSIFKLGFGLTSPTDLVLQVRPGFEYSKAIFTS